MNRQTIDPADRIAMLARLEEVRLRPDQRARARAAMLRAEALIDLYCELHARAREFASAAMAALRHSGSRGSPTSREPLLHRK